MHFKAFLEKSALDINSEIEAYLTTWSKEVVQKSSRLLPLVSALKEASTGGKRSAVRLFAGVSNFRQTGFIQTKES